MIKKAKKLFKKIKPDAVLSILLTVLIIETLIAITLFKYIDSSEPDLLKLFGYVLLYSTLLTCVLFIIYISVSNKNRLNKILLAVFAVIIFVICITQFVQGQRFVELLDYAKSTRNLDDTVNRGGEEIEPPFDPDYYPGDYILKKPVIYLYPTQKQDITVSLNYNGKLKSTYPAISSLGGWNVVAEPSGKLIDKRDGKEYSYLFWEGNQYDFNYDLSEGFVVKGSETKEFLQTILPKLGLLPKEYNEMIVYWLPLMEHNKYNLIHFAGTEYTDNAKLNITPKPDSILRVFMVYKELEKPRPIKQQKIKQFERKGFTVIEWGGTKVK